MAGPALKAQHSSDLHIEVEKTTFQLSGTCMSKTSRISGKTLMKATFSSLFGALHVRFLSVAFLPWRYILCASNAVLFRPLVSMTLKEPLLLLILHRCGHAHRSDDAAVACERKSSKQHKTGQSLSEKVKRGTARMYHTDRSPTGRGATDREDLVKTGYNRQVRSALVGIGSIAGYSHIQFYTLVFTSNEIRIDACRCHS